VGISVQGVDECLSAIKFTRDDCTTSEIVAYKYTGSEEKYKRVSFLLIPSDFRKIAPAEETPIPPPNLIITHSFLDLFPDTAQLLEDFSRLVREKGRECILYAPGTYNGETRFVGAGCGGVEEKVSKKR